MVKLEIMIDDTNWPHLKMVCTRSGLQGDRAATTDRAQYDTAYTQFENVLHNHLRPMITELNNRRLGTQQRTINR